MADLHVAHPCKVALVRSESLGSLLLRSGLTMEAMVEAMSHALSTDNHHLTRWCLLEFWTSGRSLSKDQCRVLKLQLTKLVVDYMFARAAVFHDPDMIFLIDACPKSLAACVEVVHRTAATLKTPRHDQHSFAFLPVAFSPLTTAYRREVLFHVITHNAVDPSPIPGVPPLHASHAQARAWLQAHRFDGTYKSTPHVCLVMAYLWAYVATAPELPSSRHKPVVYALCPSCLDSTTKRTVASLQSRSSRSMCETLPLCGSCCQPVMQSAYEKVLYHLILLTEPWIAALTCRVNKHASACLRMVLSEHYELEIRLHALLAAIVFLYQPRECASQDLLPSQSQVVSWMQEWSRHTVKRTNGNTYDLVPTEASTEVSP